MSPLFKYLSNAIDELAEVLEFDESGYFLEGLKSALITACDPLNHKNSGEEFKRVMLVLQTVSAIVNSGAVPGRKNDNDLILGLCNVANLPTNLDSGAAGSVYEVTRAATHA